MLKAVHNNAATDPDHRCCSDNAQKFEKIRHAQNDASPARPEYAAQNVSRTVARKGNADIVSFHDEGDASIYEGCDSDPHNSEHKCLKSRCCRQE